MRRYFKRGLPGLAAAIIALATGVSAPLSADEALQAKTPGGTKLWIVSVTAQFEPADAEAIGGQCHWCWQDAGIALVSSTIITVRQILCFILDPLVGCATDQRLPVAIHVKGTSIAKIIASPKMEIRW